MTMRYILALLGSALFSSCVIVGLTDGYKRLSPDERSSVAYGSKGQDLSRASVRMLSAEGLRAELPSDAYSLVYYYVPGCRGERCKPYELLHEEVKGKLRLFVVARNLDSENLVQRAMRLPIYGIDRYHYKTKYSFKLELRFFAELTGRSLKEMKQEYNNAFLFRGKEYLHSVDISKVDSLLATLP